MATYIDNVECSEEFLLEVKKAIGYPIVPKEVIAEIFSDEHILSSVVGDSLEDFYNYFPKIVNVSVACGGSSAETSVSAPKNCLGIVHYALSNSGASSMNSLLTKGNPFYTASVTTSVSSRSGYGTPFNFNSSAFSVYQQKFYADSMANTNKSFYARFDEDNDLIFVKSTSVGTMVVECGCYSNSVDDVPKRLRKRFKDLCKANLKVQFGSAGKLMNSDLPLEIPFSDIYDEGVEELENITEWMQNNSTIALLRN